MFCFTKVASIECSATRMLQILNVLLHESECEITPFISFGQMLAQKVYSSARLIDILSGKRPSSMSI